MKTRSSFVSNSSSSSFVLIGIPITLGKITPKILKQGSCRFCAQGLCGSEGEVWVEIHDKSMLEYVKKHAEALTPGPIYQVLYEGSEMIQFPDGENLPPGATIVGGTKDSFSPNSVDDLKCLISRDDPEEEI